MTQDPIPTYLYTDAYTDTRIGFTLTIVRWKASKDKVTGKVTPALPARCAYLPLVDTVVEPACLQVLLNSSLYTTRMEMLRDEFEEQIALHGSSAVISIRAEDYTAQAVADYLSESASGTGTRKRVLTKESITNWFDDSMADALQLAFAERLGLNLEGRPEDISPEALDKLDKVLAQYREMFAKLAAPKPSIKADNLKQLQKALGMLGSGDLGKVGGRVGEVITKCLKPQEEVSLDMLQ